MYSIIICIFALNNCTYVRVCIYECMYVHKRGSVYNAEFMITANYQF